jgi:hypothetical protein
MWAQRHNLDWRMNKNIPISLIPTHTGVTIPYYSLKKLERHYNGEHKFLATIEMKITRLLSLGGLTTKRKVLMILNRCMMQWIV